MRVGATEHLRRGAQASPDIPPPAGARPCPGESPLPVPVATDCSEGESKGTSEIEEAQLLTSRHWSQFNVLAENRERDHAAAWQAKRSAT